MAATSEINIVSYNIAVEMKHDAIDVSPNETEDESDTDSDGNCVIIRPSDIVSQTLEQNGDDKERNSTDGSDDIDKYMDTKTSRSNDTTVDDDVFVDAESETSQEKIERKVTKTSEQVRYVTASETMDGIHEIVLETLEPVQEESPESEVVLDPVSGNSEDIQSDHVMFQQAQETPPEPLVVETPIAVSERPSSRHEPPRTVVCTDSQKFAELEELDGEIEYYDTYAMFSPFTGGPSVVYNTLALEGLDFTSGEVGRESEEISNVNDTVNAMASTQNCGQNNEDIGSSLVGIEYSPNDSYAEQLSPLSSISDTDLRSLDASPVQKLCPISTDLTNQFDNTHHSEVYIQPINGGDNATTDQNFVQSFYVAPYDQQNETGVSYPPYDHHHHLEGQCCQASVDPNDASRGTFDSIQGKDVVVQVGDSGNQESPATTDTQGAVDTTSEGALQVFHNSSLNPECEPFVPAQSFDTPNCDSCNIDNSTSCVTTDSHPGELSYPPEYIQYPQDSVFAHGQFALYQQGVTDYVHTNGYSAETDPQMGQVADPTQFPYGTVHQAYPFYPENSTNLNIQLPFLQMNQQIGFIDPQPAGEEVSSSGEFRYPAIYLSEAGLITVLLRHDFSVEMTAEQVIRVVNHKKKLVALINGEGTDSYVFHPAARVTQDLSSMEMEVFLQRKVKMTTEHVTFANNFKCYTFDHEDIEEETQPDFADLGQDRSVNLLFSAENCSDTTSSERAVRIAAEAEIERGENGWAVVRINGVKIVQNERGEVIVSCGPKFIRMYPNNMSLQLKSSFVDVRIGINWSVNVRRGSHVLNASHCGFIVSNGRIEAGFDDVNKPFACLLPSRVPILNDHRKYRRRNRDICLRQGRNNY